jgi:hypothetical protein
MFAVGPCDRCLAPSVCCECVLPVLSPDVYCLCSHLLCVSKAVLTSRAAAPLCVQVTDSNGKMILFIDEIHTVVGAGAAGGAMDAGNLLKPMLGRGELRCIGATTLDEFRWAAAASAAACGPEGWRWLYSGLQGSPEVVPTRPAGSSFPGRRTVDRVHGRCLPSAAVLK